MTDERFPLQPMIDCRPDLTDKEMSVLLKASGCAWARWRERGLDEAAADRCAVRLGFHPGEIWADWWIPPVYRCGRGHEWTDENTRMTSAGKRECRACDLENKQAARDRAKAAA